MGSEDCPNPTAISSEKTDAISVAERNDVEEPAMLVADEKNLSGPITPDSERENVDFPIAKTSPPTSIKESCFDSSPNTNGGNSVCFDDHGSPRTPKEDVFNPFAPGPDDLVLAPHHRKYLSQSFNIVARRLSFDSSIIVDEEMNGGTDARDEEILKSIYEDILKVIISEEEESVIAGISSLDCGSDDCKTPLSAPRLSGIAETCPGAPTRVSGPSGKSRVIDPALCRKLDFTLIDGEELTEMGN
ncbi:hypothetical protein UlMin_000535 [Ulmus minor]